MADAPFCPHKHAFHGGRVEIEETEARNRVDRAVALAATEWLMPGDLFPEKAVAPSNPPAGGLAFWVRFREPVSISSLVTSAFRERLKIHRSNNFYSDGETPQGLRLGYASMDESELTEAVGRLYRAFTSVRDNR